MLREQREGTISYPTELNIMESGSTPDLKAVMKKAKNKKEKEEAHTLGLCRIPRKNQKLS